MSMTKQELLRLIEALPEEVSPDGFDLIAAEVRRFQRRARLQESLDQIDRGEGIPHEEMEAIMERWLLSPVLGPGLLPHK